MHMVQLMPLPLTVSCFSKIQIGFTFPVLAHLGSSRQHRDTHTHLTALFPGLHRLTKRLTYVHPCKPVIPLVPSYPPALTSSLLRLSAHHLALAASASQPLISGTLSLHLSIPVPVLIGLPSVVTSIPTTSSRPSSPLNASNLAHQIRLLLTIVRIYKLYLLAYLLKLASVITQAYVEVPSRIVREDLNCSCARCCQPLATPTFLLTCTKVEAM